MKSHFDLVEPMPTLEATGFAISNLAWQHMYAANLFRRQLLSLENLHAGEEFSGFFEDISAYGRACIMSATASLEALINELFIAHGSRLREKLGSFEEAYWGKKGIEKKSTLKKYQHALELLDATPFDSNSGPYRNAELLIELRHVLTHFKPTWDAERKRCVDLVESLDGLFPLSQFPDAGANFISMRCMSAGCANWVIKSSLDFIFEFDSRTNLAESNMNLFRRFSR